jgi:hypothetical protein
VYPDHISANTHPLARQNFKNHTILRNHVIFGNEYYIVIAVRKFLYSLLIILMLTPSLACAMPTCGPKAKESAAAALPCAEHHSGHDTGSKKEGGKGKVNLLIDCMGVDMQKADTASLDKPDIKKDLVIYALVADVSASRFSAADVGTIRGPPPDWPAFSQTQPSILLTTQRLRI